MPYLGYCDKYAPTSFMLAAVIVPPGITTAIGMAAQQDPDFIALTSAITFGIAAMGASFAHDASEITSANLKDKNCGWQAGSRIIQDIQVKIYTTFIGAAIVFNLAASYAGPEKLSYYLGAGEKMVTKTESLSAVPE